MTIISLEHVNVVREKKPILTDISWAVSAGENWAILGLNGSGKTSLIRLIMADLWKSSGQLTVLGTRFGVDQIPELRAKIGSVSSFIAERLQPSLSVETVVLTGKYKSSILFRPVTKAEYDEAITLLQTMHAETLIGRTFGSLSQGEKQLCLIARSLMNKPQILIFDEATNGLDLFAKERLLEQLHIINELSEKPTLLYITHHPDEITEDFKRLLLLKDGCVFQSGPTEEILTSANLSRFYGQEIKVEKIKERYFILPE